MSRIFWDTNLFIYLVEASGDHSKRVARLAERMLDRGDQMFTSTMTLGEVLVKPAELGNDSLRQAYEDILKRNAVLIPFDEDAARLYAELRRDHTLRAPDAIQLSCAARARVDMFITNDERLSTKIVAGIDFIVSLEKAFL
jgi:predicted nucleic acid-binding protein